MNSFLVGIAISIMITIVTQGEESSQESGNDGRPPVEKPSSKSESEFSGWKVNSDNDALKGYDQIATIHGASTVIKGSFDPKTQCAR